MNHDHAYMQKPFDPEQALSDKISVFCSSIDPEETLVWWDEQSCLCLNFWRNTLEDSKFLLFYTSPEQELANFFASEQFDVQVISQVVTAWMIRTRAMLGFYARHRTDCLLVNSESAALHGASLVDLINKQFGTELQGQFTGHSATQRFNIVDLFLASSQILGNENVAEIYDELRSLTTVLQAEDKDMADDRDRADLLFQRCVMENQVLKKALESGQKKSEQLELARAHIKELQSELEFYYTQLEAQTARNELLGSYVGDDPFLELVRKARSASTSGAEPELSARPLETE